MERLTMSIDENEYSLNDKIQLNEFSVMDIPNAIYNKLGKIEDIMEYWGIDSIDELNYKLNMNAHLKDNKVLEKALEIACKNIEGIYCTDYCGILKCQNCKFKQEFNANTYIEQAKKELE